MDDVLGKMVVIDPYATDFTKLDTTRIPIKLEVAINFFGSFVVTDGLEVQNCDICYGTRRTN